jgi:hypothetical protein
MNLPQLIKHRIPFHHRISVGSTFSTPVWRCSQIEQSQAEGDHGAHGDSSEHRFGELKLFLSEVSFAHLCMGFIRTKIVRTSSA